MATEKIERDVDIIKGYIHRLKYQENEINSLRDELLREREAVDFYADHTSWFYESNKDIERKCIGSWDVERLSEYPEEKDTFGGKLARKVKMKRKVII